MSKMIAKPNFKARMIFTIIVVILWIVTIQVYNASQGPIEAGLAVKQLNTSDVDYVAGRAVALHAIPRMINWVGWILILLTWVPYGVKYVRYDNAQNRENGYN